MRNRKLISKSISIKKKNKKRNKESIKANNTRNFLLILCDKELKEKNKKKENKTLINSQTTEEYMENYFQNFTITLEIKNNDSHQYLIENNSPFKIIKSKYLSSFFDNKKLKIGKKKCKKFEKYLNMNKSFSQEEPLDSFFQDDSLSDSPCSIIDKNTFTYKYKRFISKKSFDYLRSIFHSIHKNYHKKLLSAEMLDMLLNINLNFLSEKMKENCNENNNNNNYNNDNNDNNDNYNNDNYDKYDKYDNYDNNSYINCNNDCKLNGNKVRPKSADLLRKREIKDDSTFIQRDIFAIKLFRCLEE